MCLQGPTLGWCLRPKVPSLREVTATAARTTLPAVVCMFTEGIRRCRPTNTASSMTSTAMTLTPGHGKSTHTREQVRRMTLCVAMFTCHICSWRHMHVPGSFSERAAFHATCTQLRSSAAPCSSLEATRTMTHRSATGPSVSLPISSPMTSVGLVIVLTSCHNLIGNVLATWAMFVKKHLLSLCHPIHILNIALLLLVNVRRFI